MNCWIKGLGLWLLSVSLLAMPNIYGPTSAKEDLWHVAKSLQNHAPKTSVQQWMIGLFKYNTSAFTQHNMNGLMAGATLKTPSAEEVLAIPPNTATQLLSFHNRAWKHTHPSPHIKKSHWSLEKSDDIRDHMTALNKRVSLLNHSFHALQSHMENQYGDLSLKTKQVQQTLAALNNDLSQFHAPSLNENPGILIASLDADWTNVWTHTKSQWFAPSSLKIASVAAFLLVLMMTWVLWAPRPQTICVHESAYSDDEEDDLGDEYDFMSSEEGIPARLDLAQAYMDMDDIKSARDVLQKVLVSDSDTHYANKAKAMLQSIENT